jgi:alpha-tubulin suppressor-like RCC1 family protein
LGNTSVTGQSDSPVEMSLCGPAVDVAAGNNSVCVVLQTGVVECYGDNTYGELGDGSQGNTSSAPVFANGITNAVAIVGGYAHFCALLATGQVECWGANTEGELGNEAGGPDQDSPVFMVGYPGTPKTLDAGALNTCGINTAGALTCYGDNSRGEMGNDSESTNGDPTPWGYQNPVFSSGVTAVSIGGPYVPAGGTANWPFICALKSGNIWCAGDNTYYELGNSTFTQANSEIPIEVQNSAGNGYLTGATQLATGLGHACAYVGPTTVWCWGNDQWGQLGNNTQSFPAQQALPVAVVFQQ